MTIKGYADSRKLASGQQEFATVNPAKLNQFALDVLAHTFVVLVTSDTTEAGSTTKILNATAHIARAGDLILFTSGPNSGYDARVIRTTTNTITLAEELPSTPVVANAFEIYRQKMPKIDPGTGGIVVATAGASVLPEAAVNFGKLGFAAVGAGYSTIVAQTIDAKMIFFFNSLDTTIRLSLDGGTNDWAELESGESFSIDLASNLMQIGAAPEIRVKHTGAAPTSGTIRCTVIGTV